MNDPMTELLKDVLQQKKRDMKTLIVVLIISLCMNFAEAVVFLYFQSQWDYQTTTTTTTEQTVDGDDGNIINGDRYNDDSENRSTH